MKLERVFRTEKVPDDYINEFKKLLVDGFSVKEICSAFRIAKPLSVRIERVIKKDNTTENSNKLNEILSNYNEIEAKIIEKMSENYFIDIEEAIKISKEQQLGILDLQNKVINYEAERNSLYGIDAQSIITTSTTGGTESELDYSKHFNAPFTYERGNSENISLCNGN